MGAFSDYIDQNRPVVPDEAPSLSGEFSKGVSRGLRELGASSLQGAGLGAEALGYNDTATTLRAKAKGLRDEEAAFAPEVGSWDEVKGAGQAVRWVMGHAGQLVPVVAGAAAGGAVAGPVGAAATMVPGQFGAIDYGQQADPRLAAQPVQQRLKDATLPAIGSAALMAVPGEAVFGKLGFPAAKSLSGALVSNVGKGAATGYTTMGGADAMVQKGIDPNAPVNWDQAHDAGVGGAVAVGAMHVPHVIPSMLKGAGEAIGDSAGQVKLWGSKKLAAMKEQGAGIAEGAADMAAEAPKKVNSLWDDVMEFTRKGKEQAADLTDKVLNSEPITYTHEQIRGATPDKVWEMVEGNAKAVGEWAKSTGDSLLNKMGLDDPRRAELKDALSGLADPEQSPTAARVIAGIKAAREQADRAQKNLTDLVNHLRSSEKDDMNVKKSAEEDGVTDIVKQVLSESGLKTSRPDIFDPKHENFRPATSNAQVTLMARAMRDLVRGALKGPLDENTKLLAFKTFGPDTVPVMDAVAKAVGGSDLNRGAAENLFKNITDIQKKETMLNDLHRTIIESSAPGMEKLNHANMDMLVDLLTRHADSQFEPRGGFRREGALSKTEGDNGAQNPATQAIEHYINQIYQQRFGKNADAVREAVQRATKAEKGDEHTGPRYDEELGEYSDEEKAPKTPRGQAILRDADGNKIGSIRKEGEFDNDGNRLEAETLNVTKYGLSAPDKAGNQKLVRNGRMYRDVRTSAERDAGGKPNYVTQHLADLRAKYPDKSVDWVESSPAQYDKAGKLVKHAEGHIEVSEKMDVSQISDGDMEAMALDTHKYPNSKSRIDFVDKDGNPIAKYKALDSVAVGRVLYGRKLGSYEPDHRVSFAEQLRDNFIEGISSIAQKYNALPRIPDEAIIGRTKEGPLTWGEAKKLGRAGRRETPDEMRMAELHQHLNELEKQAFLMTAPDAVIRALNEKLAAQAKEAGRPAPKEIRRINASRDDVKDIKDVIKKIDKEMAVIRNKELSQDADTPRDEKAEAVRHLDPTRPRNGTTEPFNRPPGLADEFNKRIDEAIVLPPAKRAKAFAEIQAWYDGEIAKANPRVPKEKYKDDLYATTENGKRTLNNPVDPYDSIWKTEYDENGNLVRGGITREGVRQLLEGNYDGGINIGGQSRIEGEAGRILDPLDRFDGGQGRQEMGKDEQVHLQFAGRGKQDRPFYGRRDEDGRPIEDLVHRSNMDGTPHFVSDRWSEMQSMQLMGHELKARVGVANRKLGERILALAKPEVLTRMSSLDHENFLLGTMPDLKVSSRAKIINPLFEKYSQPVDEVKTTSEARLAAKERKASQRGVSDYGDREYAFQELQQRIDVMSDRMAEYELKRREFMLKTGYGDADLQKIMQTEVSMLKKRLANGRPAVPDVQFNDHADWLGYKWKDVEGNDLFSQGTTKRKLVRDSNPYEGMYDVGRKPQPLRISDDIKDLGEPRTGDPRFGDARTGEVDVTNGSGDLRTGELNLGKPVEAPAKNTLKLKKKAADTEEFRTTEDRLMQLFGGTPEPEGSRVMEGSPGPKAVAAKKAALEQAASSSNPELHKQLATSTDAPSLKRTVDHLNTVAKPDAGTVEAIELANKRIGELVREDPQNAYNLQLKKSLDSTKPESANAATPETRAAVEDYIKRVAPKVSLEWKGLSELPYAGDYNHVAKLVRLSVHANNPMGTAFHESLHHFIASMRDAGATDVAQVLERAASQKHVIDQLNEIYKDKPEVLAQLKDPEERAAYMYQHWALDPNFKVSIAAKNVFGKIAQFLRNMFGMWSNDERALHIMDYFHKGEFGKNADKPNYVREQLMNTHRNEIVEKFKDIVEPVAHVADAIVSAGGARLRDTDIPAIQTIADLIKRQHTDDRGGDRGFVPAQRIEMTKRLHAFGEGLEKFLPPESKAPGLMTKALESATGIKAPTTVGRAEVMRDALEALQRGERASTPEGRLLASFVKKTLRETRQYMVDAGVKIGDLGADYFPREWDMHYISKNQQAFRDMLEPYIRSGKMKGTADQLVRNLTSQGGSEIGIEGRGGRETREPGMQFKKERMLAFIDPRDAAPFLKKDLMSTMASYITQATRKAEWTRRLGNGKLEYLLDNARSQGAEQKHLDLVEDYLKANDGTLGDTLNPTARRLMGDMIVYQNVRLLPLASFSMMIDPLGTVVRGAKVGEAWNTFKRGMAGIRDTFKKEGEIPRDKATEWAELVGVVDSAMMSHAMSDVFTQGMVGGTAKNINQTFFKYNFVEGLNRNFRIGATESAMKFIVRHADGKASPHSMRWFKELGLQDGDVKMHDGRLALTEAEGLTKEQVGRVHAAINQWVDGAILRPDAADKPIWMNDPHYALISHLKQFVYSFQHTILERVGHEFRHGNYAPAVALASYLPTMMAADFAKNFIVNGGGQPDWQKGWDMWDYVENGVERSGFYGVNQFWIDAAKDIHRGNTGIFRLAGPTIEQGRDAIETLGGRRQFSSTAIDALPANAILKPMVGAETKADPVFAE